MSIENQIHIHNIHILKIVCSVLGTRPSNDMWIMYWLWKEGKNWKKFNYLFDFIETKEKTFFVVYVERSQNLVN